ncbi:MAG TPA: ATP-dependent DNA helicase [Magnetospirillaceae bacterium]|jgi:ATP-dependent DNA helicase DinG
MNQSVPQPHLPEAPALITHPRGAVWLTPDGEIAALTHGEAARRAKAQPPMLCHRNAVAARLGVDPFPAFDLLELFAFVRPAKFVVPTVRGLAEALDLPAPKTHEDEAATLPAIAAHLLVEFARRDRMDGEAKRAEVRGIALVMARAGWAWGPGVLAAIGAGGDKAPVGAFNVWEHLPEWQETAPEPPPGSQPVEPSEARMRLAQMLGSTAEERPSQADYASAAAMAFAPRDVQGVPKAVLAEAGTGTGKTLGYIAPASLWAEKNQAPVWISTYTRNLQRQLDAELDRLYRDPAVKARKVVVRKGRENYLCLLNFEEAAARLRQTSLGSGAADAVALGLMARWILATRDGDMVGGDLPGWFPDLFGRPRTLGLADRRGECIYAACAHYRKCFIERTVRRARKADIVVANHALVMVQAAMGGIDDGNPPLRTVFDEGHHVFDAADSAFSALLSGAEAAELRRWLLGAEEGGRSSRARGLKRRCEDLIAGDDKARLALDEAMSAARVLPGPGWHARLAEGSSTGACEAFLGLVRQQVRARAPSIDGPYGLECEPFPLIDGLADAARSLAAALGKLASPLTTLAKTLTMILDAQAGALDSSARQRLEAVARSIDRRALVPLAAWREMLNGLADAALNPDWQADARFVDWFAIERIEGRDFDTGFHRHWIDPTIPFAKFVVEPSHGILVTSATLRDGSGDLEADWAAAERRAGTIHLPQPAMRAAMASPFDYPAHTRVLVVKDVRKDDIGQVAAAFRELFLAAGGGGLGLFTAISRLRAVQEKIAPALDQAGIPLFAQHVDGMDTSTIVDIFRAEEDACLLGTDAVRDGVDVPGRSLRLIVFDRVPWPRPDILHKARRAAFGKRSYDDMITRLRLKQAFGRLVRRADDRGVFVLLDPLMPSRLAGAFPPGVELQKVGLAEAVAITKAFLDQDGPQSSGLRPGNETSI